MKTRSILLLSTIFLMEIAIMNCRTNPKDCFITLGMTKADVAKYCSLASDEYRIMTEPAQIRPAYDILIDDIRYTLAFDEDDCICRISTKDSSFRLVNGIGINSKFGELIKAYGNYKIDSLLGYGRMVEVDTGIRFGFAWINRNTLTISNDEKVEWIELQRLPSCGNSY